MSSGQGRAALVSLGVSVLVLGLKTGAFLLTDSVSLLSDAAESVVNVLAAIVLLIAVRLAAQPPDYEHPYGHEKAELLSGAFEALLIFAAGAMIMLTAVQRFFAPHELDNLPAGLITAGLAGAVNLALALWLRRRAKRLGSAALDANARHIMTDVWSSVGVLTAVLLVGLTGWLVLDPLVAILVSLNILREGWQLLGTTLSQLLDERLPEAEEAEILALLDATEDILGYHRLRSRMSGSARFLEVDVFLDPQMNVEEAHAIVKRLEDRLARALPNMVSTIHIEPHAPGVREGFTPPREEYDSAG